MLEKYLSLSLTYIYFTENYNLKLIKIDNNQLLKKITLYGLNYLYEKYTLDFRWTDYYIRIHIKP